MLRVRTPMARFGYYLYKKKNTAVDINDPKSLANRKTCLTFGNRLRYKVARDLKLKVTQTSNTSQCLKMLTTERVDVFFGPRPELEDPSLKDLNEQLVRADQPYMTVNLYIYLNEKHSELAKKLEQNLDKYFVTVE
ncbi:transporter substrate-binding domain-containing protein [Bdellovibrio reynosensis]|uniref:Transporter substrate-binding domain-containing protein n=1 Tax=Bdellovibrio reynosensis TaxID=2835041 RepID=A0ABY4CDB0_9BACT|nr:transporter substrate-binding domain-containing protein [Bdellovibrio reynosensis]